VYPGRAGCPNVGWNFTLDTGQLPNGTHILEITGKSSGGQYSTVTATFSVSNAPNNPIIITTDAPAANGNVFGSVTVAGWAIDAAAAISTVSILVDGVPYGNAIYGGPRTDVCAVYPNGVGCPNVGWSFILDTTLLANGAHALDIRASSTTGQQATVSSSFNVSNQN
jgi:hypothetical protein